MTGGTDTLLILHCHIPKTAGTSISGGLRNAFENFHFHHYHPDPFYILTPQILEDLLRIDPALRSISSHHLRSFPLSIAGRPTFLFTFLRKPEDVFISQLKHAQRQFSEFPEPVRRLWPKETPRMPLRELAWQYLELATAHQDFCPQTRFFGNPDAMARLGLSDGNRYGFESCEIARSILSDFHFVGIVDQMKKSLDVLTHLLMDRGIKVYFDLRLKLNCCPDPARPAWLNVEDEVGRRVLETSKSDRLLYCHFRGLLLGSHRKLRERRWLGLRPAVADARESFGSRRWRGAAQSLVNSGRLFCTRHRINVSPNPTIESEFCSETLESRAARAFVEGGRRQMIHA